MVERANGKEIISAIFLFVIAPFFVLFEQVDKQSLADSLA